MKIDIKYNDGSKIFFTSDTHFCHENIIKFVGRPFENADEMNEALISRWNEKVPEDGLVFHLGDFAFASFKKWEEIRSRLNGEIVLIKGNHDIKQFQKEEQYLKLFKYSAWQMYIEIEKRKIYLNHNPFLCYGGTYRDNAGLVYQLFGHVHSIKGKGGGKDGERLEMLFPTQYDVGVDNNDFTPISWYEVDAIIQQQIQNAKK